MICRKETGYVKYKEHMFGGEGTAVITELFLKGEYKGSCRLMATLTLKPGESVGHHVHENDEEFVYILSGSCKYEDNGIWTRLEAGEASLTRSGESHTIINDTESSITYIAVVLTYS